MIDPTSVAFDIDGVVADTMTLFLDIARDEYLINGLRYEDIIQYDLESSLKIDRQVIEAIIAKILDGTHKASLNPIAGAPEALTRLARNQGKLLFVTARPRAEFISDWIQNKLPLVDSASIEVISTGVSEAKSAVLSDKGITCFVEDRLETCFQINEAGITPVLFKQPWNRQKHPFTEVADWKELEALIFDG